MVGRLFGWVRKFRGWFKRQSKKKKVAFGVVILVVVVGWWRMTGSKGAEYQLTRPERGTVVEVVSETGNVVSGGIVPVYSTTTGVVKNVFVDNGQRVKAGDKLVEVQSTATDEEKSTALAGYLTAKSKLEAAKAQELSLQAVMFAEWDEYKELAEGDDYENEDGSPKVDQRNLPEFYIPQREWQAAEANYKNQQTVVSQAQAQVAAAWLDYQATQNSVIKATNEGVVQNLGVVVGQAVSQFSQAVPTEPLLMVVGEAVTSIKLEINESDIGKVAVGQSAVIKLDALVNREFTGSVLRVDGVGTSEQGVVTYGVYIVVDGEDGQMLPGMTADVDITTVSKENVLTVPTSAVKPYQGGRAVRVVDENGEIEYVPVEVGSKGENRIEILSGIDEDTEIIEALSNEQVDRNSSSFF